MGADGVDLVGKGEVACAFGPLDLCLVAGATGLGHAVRIGRPGDEAGMGRLLLAFTALATVAGGAGKVVGRVQTDVAVTGQAPGGANRDRTGGGKGVGREQQQGEKQGEKAIHSLDTLP